jgi:hypothetical protein
LVIQPLEESKELLELLRDIVRQGRDILDLIVQASHEGITFRRVHPLNIDSIARTWQSFWIEVLLIWPMSVTKRSFRVARLLAL